MDQHRLSNIEMYDVSMSLSEKAREEVRTYCKRDLPGDLAWHVSQFAFITDAQLQRRLGRAFYSARYMSKLMEALFAQGDEKHAFVKFQIIQYASIYEAVICNLLWGRYKNHSAVQKLLVHKTFKRVDAFAKPTSMTYENQQVFTCVSKVTKKQHNDIAFKEKVDCAVEIGFLEAKYAADIKLLYELRNLAHIEAEAKKQIDVEIEQAKNGYWRMKPFLEKIVAFIHEETDVGSKSA